MAVQIKRAPSAGGIVCERCDCWQEYCRSRDVFAEEMCGVLSLASKDSGDPCGAAVTQGFQRAWSPFKQVVEDA